ncbi:MAG: TenA family transcriptional regulator [Armatimonadetes bacterium]|nr:TenA family transcriptional regulator [Armatimonadota bacterium]
MTAADLLPGGADLWEAATRHPFLDGIRDGPLPETAFDRWLAQDYLFVEALVRVQARILAAAPRRDFPLLAGGISALVDELAWFEEKARVRGVPLSAPMHPTCRAYTDFLHALTSGPYAAQITALWALERAYLDAWTGARPGAPAYREFVEHWTVPAFQGYVRGLEAAVTQALGEGGAAVREAAAEAFCWVARYEAAFWEIGVAT